MTLRQGNPRWTASAIVTAGLRCAPETPAEAYTPNITARPQARLIASQLPASCRLRTNCATTAAPKTMSRNVPRNSASSSRTRPRSIDNLQGQPATRTSRNRQILHGFGRSLRARRAGDDRADEREVATGALDGPRLAFGGGAP